ncbi:MAG: OmpH family outer membrane protein [Saprospiraceae bacterium]|jgi:outer membrane protein
MKKSLLIICVLWMGIMPSWAQKYGHLNYGNVLTLMPEVKQADAQLEAFQKELVSKGERMAVEFRGNVAKFMTEQQSGILSPKEQQTKREALEKEQVAIEAYEQEIQRQVNLKREELLKPLTDKLDKAIEAVAKANGFTLVFDTGAFNAVLFGDESIDLFPMVKKELGVN